MTRFAVVLAATAALAQAAPETVALPGKSPLVTFRVVFRTGSASDPAGKAGLAALTASMLAEGGTKQRTYKQLVEAMYPMATTVSAHVDKEMTTFTASTHIDNLEAFYALFREMLLEPGWRADDFTRLRDNQINYLRVSLRGNNDEELGKEVLYESIYAGHPYGHVNEGHVSGLRKLDIDDLQQFYKNNYTQANLILGIAGGYLADFVARMQKDFAKLEKGSIPALKLSAPKPVGGLHMTLVEKNTRSVAFSLGHPISVRRGDPDYPALLLAQSYFGQHRNSSGRLYNRIRELRGINYGDYAYIEYFPRGMFRFEPEPNLARQQQIFQIWIRPVEPPTAHFTLRLAMYEFERLLRDGIPQEDFDRTRNFLSKYVNLLLKTRSAELGYAIDSKVYGIGGYADYLRSALAKLTRDDVNRAIRKHLRAADLQIVVIGQGMDAFRAKLLANEPSPMKYNAPKPEEITAEDKIVQDLKLPLKAENVNIVIVDKIFE
ncbi:MAG TPA: pitrilysin family protein [Bryobacteraceae bacterium]|nr:pitrilysin family protein [Bryobacteraceae bacterium]